MSWTWTGYDHDAVHRFKDEAFFQTGRNIAEARFWKLKIHEMDRRGTKSSIALGDIGGRNTDKIEDDADNGKNLKTDEYKYSYTAEDDAPLEYHTSYPDPRDRSLSVVSVRGRGAKYMPSRDYHYNYGKEDIMEEDENDEGKKEEDQFIENKRENQMKNKSNTSKEPNNTEAVLRQQEQVQVHGSSRFY